MDAGKKILSLPRKRKKGATVANQERYTDEIYEDKSSTAGVGPIHKCHATGTMPKSGPSSSSIKPSKVRKGKPRSESNRAASQATSALCPQYSVRTEPVIIIEDDKPLFITNSSSASTVARQSDRSHSSMPAKSMPASPPVSQEHKCSNIQPSMHTRLGKNVSSQTDLFHFFPPSPSKTVSTRSSLSRAKCTRGGGGDGCSSSGASGGGSSYSQELNQRASPTPPHHHHPLPPPASTSNVQSDMDDDWSDSELIQALAETESVLSAPPDLGVPAAMRTASSDPSLAVASLEQHTVASSNPLPRRSQSDTSSRTSGKVAQRHRYRNQCPHYKWVPGMP